MKFICTGITSHDIVPGFTNAVFTQYKTGEGTSHLIEMGDLSSVPPGGATNFTWQWDGPYKGKVAKFPATTEVWADGWAGVSTGKCVDPDSCSVKLVRALRTTEQ